jgi:hypothetical protein
MGLIFLIAHVGLVEPDASGSLILPGRSDSMARRSAAA